ncbi:MAG: hypothetical protein U0174_19815 [Polyangiaceae bacterium]
MADRVTKNGGFTAPTGQADSDSASVDTLLEGVLGGDVQAAKARIPKRARQETAPGLSVIIDEDPPMGGRRKAFLPEEEQVARMAPTIPSSLREQAVARDTIVSDGPHGQDGRTSKGRSLLFVGFVGVALVFIAIGAAGLFWGIEASKRAERAAELAASAAAKVATSPASVSPSSSPMSSSVPAAPSASSTAAPSASPTSSVASTRVVTPGAPPSSTYGHLVPGGRH